jgi:hypothetical protein
VTEAEWTFAADPTPMLEFIRNKVSDRKLRLFLCGCTRLLPPSLLSGEVAETLRLVEAHVDGDLSLDALNVVRSRKDRTFLLCKKKMLWQRSQAVCAQTVRARLEATEGPHWAEEKEERVRLLRRERPVLANLIRCIFGNPLCPVTLDPSWRTSTVVALATGIYSDLAFDRMPILADALQDAGCENEDILIHCREPGEHFRGCRVVDLILKKE